jgi:hypothetical protein
MVMVALILGLLGGAAGLAIALGVDITAPGAALVLPTVGELFTPKIFARFAAAVTTLLGVIVVVPKRVIGGVLMLIGAIGMVLTFEFNSTTAIPIVLSAMGATVAVYSAG